MLRQLLLLSVSLGLLVTAPELALARARKSSSHASSSGHRKHASSKRKKKKQKHYRPPEIPQSLELTQFDLVTGQGQLIVVGTKHIPEIRLLVLTDDRGRRFVPDMADCQPPVGVSLPADGSDPALVPANLRWRCTFSVPLLYRRAALVGVAMEWGDKVVEVPAKKVSFVYAAAAKSVPSAPLPREDGVIAPRPVQRPDGEDGGGDAEDSEILDEEVSDSEDNQRER